MGEQDHLAGASDVATGPAGAAGPVPDVEWFGRAWEAFMNCETSFRDGLSIHQVRELFNIMYRTQPNHQTPAEPETIPFGWCRETDYIEGPRFIFEPARHHDGMPPGNYEWIPLFTKTPTIDALDKAFLISLLGEADQALRQAAYEIKGREHTGFIEKVREKIDGMFPECKKGFYRGQK